MINPDHLLELVEKEVNVPAAGAPRQALVPFLSYLLFGLRR